MGGVKGYHKRKRESGGISCKVFNNKVRFAHPSP